jgi:glycosyltransferase involved in cell wall biosynthesis
MLDQSFVLITCVYNSEKYIDDCVQSCINQGDDIGHIIVDDCSTDTTFDKLKKYKSKNRLILRTNKRSRTPGYLQYKLTKELIKNPETLVGVIDGDDMLLPNAVRTVQSNIKDNWLFCGNYYIGSFTYHKLRKSRIPDFDKPIRDQRYSLHHFRGWKKHLSDKVNPEDFFTEQNKLMGAGSDVPYMYAMLEMAGKDRVIHIDEALYYYNIYNPINDHKVNIKEQHYAVINKKGIDQYDTIK